MSIIEKIFWDYQEGRFRVEPDHSKDRDRSARMREFEKSFAMSAEQAEKFEQFLYETVCDYQQLAFADGFRTAFDLMTEVVGC